jgi:CubicO group peptidase (beta-lactamase class C family)
MSRQITRRSAVQSLLSAVPSIALSSTLFAADSNRAQTSITGKTHKDLTPFDDLMTGFVQSHQVPGASLAVTRNSRLIYARGFGWADVEQQRPVQPDSLFRIASVSKPITAVAILQLFKPPKFSLNDRVFDILPAEEWLPGNHDERLRSITIRQLLQHTAGWDRDKSLDPIGRPNQVSQVVNHPLPVGPADVVRFTLTLPLDFDPGARIAYSNVGYLLLGQLIKHISGVPYDKYVKQHVLKPIGVTRMQLGRSCKGDLAPNEVRYYDAKLREWPAVNGPQLGVKVPIVYGGENFEAFEAHGGWIASAPDLVKFAAAFDHPASSKLLKAGEIGTMWERPAGAAGQDSNGKPSAAYYGCGWNVRPVGNQGRANAWHSGLIAGTSTLLVRRHDGLNWVVLFNTDMDQAGKNLADEVDPLIHQAADAVKRWPDRALTI